MSDLALRSSRDRSPLMHATACVALVALLPYAWMLGQLVVGGVHYLSWGFLTEAPTHSGRSGGILPIIVSTLSILAVALVAVVSIGLGTAIVLCELSRRHGALGRGIGLSLDVLAGVPSIVFGLFGNTFFCVTLGLGFSIYAGGLTLACMALPLFVRTVQTGLSQVPEDWRRGAVALGMSRTAVFLKLLLPAATPAIGLGIVLSTGRALAETAALVFTSGYVDRMPTSLHDSGRALSVHIYDLTMNIAGAEGPACATALVLITLIGLINGLTYWLGDRLLARGITE